jgi:membrane protease YdiL (CAAX protease family)
MSDRALALWLRVGSLTALAWATLAVPVARPATTLAPGAATVVGCAAGVAVFAAVARRAPRLAAPGSTLPVAIAKHAFLGLWAVNEELVWRRLVLGEALRCGPLTAVAASAVGFALFHRARRRTHLVTGASFGAVYVGTGSLAAAIAAHWTYNTLVAAVVERTRAPTVEVSST